MKKVLITGGAGFIGSDAVRRFAREGFEVCVVDSLTYAGDLERLKEVKDKINFHRVDITDKEALKEVFKREKPDVVIHYAAESHVDRSIKNPEPFVDTNVKGTLNLLELSRDTGVEKFIHISTDEVYGDLPLNTDEKFTEESPLKPSSPYSASKAGADLLVQSFIRTYGFPALIVRASNNYGPWQYPEKLIPRTIALFLSGKKAQIYGTGQNVRTWLYVEDFTEAILKLIEKGKIGEVYNVGSGEERNNVEVVRAIAELMGLKFNEVVEFVEDRPGHDLRYAVDTTKIEQETGWRAKVNFEEGLEKTLNWYLQNRDWLFKKVKEVEEFYRSLKQ
jgi:dTDP-glucose 4,6-dehydratase